MAAGQTHVNISQGTEAYLPVEVFKEFAITEATDVYSLGPLMWEIYYGIFGSAYMMLRRRARSACGQVLNAFVVQLLVNSTVLRQVATCSSINIIAAPNIVPRHFKNLASSLNNHVELPTQLVLLRCFISCDADNLLHCVGVYMGNTLQQDFRGKSSHILYII